MSVVVYDTNVLVALLSPTDALHKAAREAALAWDTKGARVVMSTVSWAELRVGAIRRGTDAERALTAFCRSAVDEIVPVNTAIADAAARYRAADLTLRLPDALVVATGQYMGAAAVLTADRKLQRVDPTLVNILTP